MVQIKTNIDVKHTESEPLTMCIVEKFDVQTQRKLYPGKEPAYNQFYMKYLRKNCNLVYLDHCPLMKKYF